MNQSNVYRLRAAPLRVMPGVLYWMRAAASDIGLDFFEWCRECFHLETDGGYTARLVVRAVTRAHIAVTGTCGHIVGSLEDVMSGAVAIDEPTFPTDRSRIACRLGIIVDHADLERDGDGHLTGRLDPARRRRRPGRNKSIQAERARTLLEQLPDLSGSADAPADAR